MSFSLDEKMEFHAHNQPWLSEEETLNEALVSKKDEIKKYNKLLRLYGAESPNLEAFTHKELLLPQNRRIAVNKVMEKHHSMKIENKLLNFFLIVFSIFCMIQLVLIAIVKFDLDLPSLNSFTQGDFLRVSYLCLLLLGKGLTYVFMAAFFFRVYIGMKLFGDSMSTNALIRLIHLQFWGFLTSSIATAAIVGLDLLLNTLLTGSEDVGVHDLLNKIVMTIVTYTNFLDWVFYCTVTVGLVLTTMGKLAKLSC